MPRTTYRRSLFNIFLQEEIERYEQPANRYITISNINIPVQGYSGLEITLPLQPSRSPSRYNLSWEPPSLVWTGILTIRPN